jgi:DNA repair photolyase
MSRRAVFVPYRPKTILNKHKRADHWFWTRYSAYPYIGCQHGCEFCYCRERKYSPYDDPLDFAHVIKVKENASDLLRRALGRVPVDMVFTGDYQPAERKFELSRRMLEVCLDLGFPVFVLERSPLVERDLDLIRSIHEKARAVVAFSVIATPESPGYDQVHQLERLSPPAEKRFRAMERFATAGIPTGTCFMPILPGLCDDEANLEAVVRWTADHGGSFVLAGGLTLADHQRSYFLGVLEERFSDLVGEYERLYPSGSYAAAGYDHRRLGRRVREICERHGLADRMPRPIIPGDKHAGNKRIVEELANRLYGMDLDGEASHRVWAHRKAAWAIEDLDQDVSLVYRTMGLRGLESIEGIGRSMARVVGDLLPAAVSPASQEPARS